MPFADVWRVIVQQNLRVDPKNAEKEDAQHCAEKATIKEGVPNHRPESCWVHRTISE
jgi:hypothetical protein